MKPDCPECFNTGIVRGKRCFNGFCRAFEQLYEPCGNCDVDGLIPMGKASDDCVVCEGAQWVKKISLPKS